MTSRDSDLPEHEQRAWDAIVADLSGQIDLGPEFPKERSLPALAADGDHPDPLADPVELDDDDAGYEPPHPPPLPRPSDAVGALLLGGRPRRPVLVIATNMLGWDRWLAGLGVAQRSAASSPWSRA